MKAWLLFVRMRYLKLALFIAAMVPGVLWAVAVYGAPSAGWLAVMVAFMVAVPLLFAVFTVEHMVRCRALFLERLCTYVEHNSQDVGRVPDTHLLAAYLFIRRYPFAGNEVVFGLAPASDIKPNTGEPEGTKYARLHFRAGDLRIRFCELRDPSDSMLFNMQSIGHKDIHNVLASAPLKGRVLKYLLNVCK